MNFFFFKMAQNGALQGKMTEPQLINMLDQISEKKSEPTIKVFFKKNIIFVDI